VKRWIFAGVTGWVVKLLCMALPEGLTGPLVWLRVGGAALTEP